MERASAALAAVVPAVEPATASRADPSLVAPAKARAQRPIDRMPSAEARRTAGRLMAGKSRCCSACAATWATLAASGRRVRLYAPFGRDWWLYALRRIGESPGIAKLLARAVVGRG